MKNKKKQTKQNKNEETRPDHDVFLFRLTQHERKKWI